MSRKTNPRRKPAAEEYASDLDRRMIERYVELGGDDIERNLGFMRKVQRLAEAEVDLRLQAVSVDGGAQGADLGIKGRKPNATISEGIRASREIERLNKRKYALMEQVEAEFADETCAEPGDSTAKAAKRDPKQRPAGSQAAASALSASAASIRMLEDNPCEADATTRVVEQAETARSTGAT